ncbi:MAG TPA: hypothetical protein DEO88_06485, partial [Syntrophobacteraceae bacterium]|nr:hypothetical protein [Syntrophobacteraceae bacterium]
LSTYSDLLPKLEPEPRLQMHPVDAAQLGLAERDGVLVRFPNEDSVRVQLALADTMARGVAILPRHRLLPWQQGGKEGPVVVAVEREP